MIPRAACVLTAAFVLVCSGTALGQQCLHGEDEHPLEQDRRLLALNSVRVINTAQSGHVAQFGRYVPFAVLATSPAMLRFRDSAGRFGDTFRWMSLQAGTDLIPGFSLQLLTDGQSYMLSLKDQSDPCHFAYTSDEGGLIREARPIR